MATKLMAPLTGRSNTKVVAGEASNLKCATAQYTLTAALALNDVLQGPLLSKARPSST